MGRRLLSETAAKAGIYAITTLMLLSFVLFLHSAVGYQAASPASSAQAAVVQSQPPAASGQQGGPEARLLDPGSQPPSSVVASLPPASSSLPESSIPPSSAPPSSSSSPDGSSSDRQQPDGLLTSNEPGLDETALAAELDRIAAMTGISLSMLSPSFQGEFHATAYCCEVYPHICGGNGVTASGTVPTPGLTCAADWKVFPPGTWLYIQGVGIRRVEDSGSAIKGSRLDIAVDTHDNALRWPGYGRHNVWLLVPA